jgi:hypothetical protein
MFDPILDLISDEFSGERAKDYVADIIRYHRIQASPGFRKAANHCAAEFRKMGLDTKVLKFPAHSRKKYWSFRMFEEWDAKEGWLEIISPKENRSRIADYSQVKLSMIQRSGSYNGVADVILLEHGTEPEEYEDIDVEGKFVLTKAYPSLVYHLAVEERGAAGIIYDGMLPIPPVRHPMDVADALQYTSFFWTSKQKPCPGFVLSPKEGEKLRSLIKKQEKDNGDPVRVRAKVRASFRKGTFEVVSALIPGKTKKEILILAHLCHPQPSANDNASGVATAMETARALKTLIDDGKLRPPRRSIRFLLIPEMTGTIAYLATRKSKIRDIVAALNLDMVGENQKLCDSSWLHIKAPHANPSFVDDLIEEIIESISGEASGFGGVGSFPLFAQAETPFMAGSDHYMLVDPTVDVPCPMFNQWPDKYYHTSMDTLDKVDSGMLHKTGIVTGTYAYFLSNAGKREAMWLGQGMVSRFEERLARLVRDEISREMSKPGTDARERITKKIRHHLSLELSALETLARIGYRKVGPWQSDARKVAKALELRVGRSLPKRRAKSRARKKAETSKSEEAARLEQKASRIVLKRVHPGPISIQSEAWKLKKEQKRKLAGMMKEYGFKMFVDPVLATYWIDGKRSLRKIAELVEMEAGRKEIALLLDYFELATELGLVTRK